ncbi:MAG TPA: hypothetical protein VGL06_01315 [Pseudonocardiaceae bacterium]|jgi:hypothetical protein
MPRTTHRQLASVPTVPADPVVLSPPADDGLGPLYRTPIWSDELVLASGLRITDVPFVTVGGGPASFVLVDFLRICGVPDDEIRVVSTMRTPYENLHHLMRCAQILDDDPLRSDSMSRLDNVWGFPGYAVEQALARRSLRPLWTVLAEPLMTEFYNPSPRQVFAGIDREARRIDWASMVTPGRASVVRKRVGGGYFCLVRPTDGAAPFVLCSRYIHLATGYPAVNYAPEVTNYRIRYGEYFNVVNAYEPHEHVYQVLTRRPATVLVRGAGITAARVLERLLDDRARSGQDLRVLHLFRTYVDQPRGPLTFRRRGGDGWSYQPFSFPKGATSGQLRGRMLELDGARRAEFIRSIGGTTSARRRRWLHQLRRARAAGHYRAFHGDLRELTPTPHDRVEVRVDVDTLPANTKLEVDFVIDCTGLRPALRENPLLSDLLDMAGADRNPLGGLDVGPHFEVCGADHEQGRIYASGVITQGGYLAPVDSFWGFAHAGLLICDDLARHGFCARLGMGRSVAGWVRWLTGACP